MIFQKKRPLKGFKARRSKQLWETGNEAVKLKGQAGANRHGDATHRAGNLPLLERMMIKCYIVASRTCLLS